jgi:hypothetical protein
VWRELGGAVGDVGIGGINLNCGFGFLMGSGHGRTTHGNLNRAPRLLDYLPTGEIFKVIE